MDICGSKRLKLFIVFKEKFSLPLLFELVFTTCFGAVLNTNWNVDTPGLRLFSVQKKSVNSSVPR